MHAVCAAMGVSYKGRLGDLCSRFYLRAGVTKAWRQGNAASDTAVMLVVTFFLKIVCTLMEERIGSKMHGPRRKEVHKYVRLLFKDGPWEYRAMAYGMVVCVFCTVTTELADAARNGAVDSDDS